MKNKNVWVTSRKSDWKGCLLTILAVIRRATVVNAKKAETGNENELFGKGVVRKAIRSLQ